MKTHLYETVLRWIGNLGNGTAQYNSYSRNCEIDGAGKSAAISGSSDPHFRGDRKRYNPEELLVASLSSCHMLWYLHLCAVNGVVVIGYEDAASGTMVEAADGSGRMTGVALRPKVLISAASDPEKALALHSDAHRLCFIANSVNFPVTHTPTIAQE